MARISRQIDNLFLTLSNQSDSDLVCMGARVRDELSKIPEMRMEFYSRDASFDPKNVLGTKVTLKAENGFAFAGIVISVEDLGHQDNIDLFAAEVRPWPWLLTIGADNRVFQGMTTPEIVKMVFSEAGFTDVSDKTWATYEQREYCVQYGESNFDFVSRIMEEDGIHYFFDHSGPTEMIVLADSISAHTNHGHVPFTISNRVGEHQADAESIFEWSDVGRVVTGMVSLFDYDMELPNADLKVKSSVLWDRHFFTNIQRYQVSGHYKKADKGIDQARVQAEAHAGGSRRSVGVANAAKVVIGCYFRFEHANHPSSGNDYLVTRATHYMRFNTGLGDDDKRSLNRHVERIDYPVKMALFETEFEVQGVGAPYRPVCRTPWPEVPGLLTAVVTGPKGDEIYTDEYGRIKVQFPWDRVGKRDDTSSCWVRTVMPWTGKEWGFLAVPRIGNEVIIQFERGNIDRPICTGMVYNATNMPPYTLPGDMNKLGLRTNSTKGGGGFHELTFDDTKGSENVFFQSEGDYKQIVKNNAEITIGMEKKKDGNLTQTIYKNKTETIKTGDMKLTVETGSRVTSIKTDETTTIEGKSTHTITGDTTLEIKNGNLSEKVSMGNMDTKVAMGNQSIAVDMGNIAIKASLGKIEMEAMQSIELKVGGNSVKIDQTGVTITGMLVKVEAKVMAEIKAVITQVNGDAMLKLKGGITMIN